MPRRWWGVVCLALALAINTVDASNAASRGFAVGATMADSDERPIAAGPRRDARGYDAGHDTLRMIGEDMRFPTVTGTAPPWIDCDEEADAGRLVVRTDGATNLYVCTGTRGWVGLSGTVASVAPSAALGGSPSPMPNAPRSPGPASSLLVLLPAVSSPGEVRLSWRHDDQLLADDWFDVRIWADGGAPTSVANVKDSSYRIGGNFPGGTYNWTIVVVRRAASGAVTELAAASSAGRFVWSGGSSGTGPPLR
jgi:hypothetical protein